MLKITFLGVVFALSLFDLSYIEALSKMSGQMTNSIVCNGQNAVLRFTLSAADECNMSNKISGPPSNLL